MQNDLELSPPIFTGSAFVVREEEVSVARFRRMLSEHRSEIVGAQIVPPQLGQKGFGSIRIRIRSKP